MPLSGQSTKVYDYPESANYKSEYLGCLDAKQKEALVQIRDEVKKQGLDLSPWISSPEETEDHLLLRFLRARKFNVKKSLSMLQKDLEWRDEKKVLSLRDAKEEQVLGCSLSIFSPLLPIWHQGHDRVGRPVIYKKFGSFEIWKITQHTSLENLVMHHVWSMERYMALCRANTKRLGYMVETVTLVIDAAGWGLSLFTREATSYLRQISNIDSDHFPERLGRIIVVNAPYLLSVAWKVISAWLDVKTREKIQILRGPYYYEPVLKELIDPDQLSEEYGGNAKSAYKAPEKSEKDVSKEETQA